MTQLAASVPDNKIVAIAKKQPRQTAEQKDMYRFALRLDPGIARRLNDFWHDQRFDSKNEAINWLLDLALKQNPKKPK